jgi:N-acetylglucosamine transport system permease protein
MSIVAVGVLWGFVFHPRLGILNSVLSLLGVQETLAWLGDPNLALWAIAGVMVWHEVGFHMVLFIAAISGIPKDYYEAAMIDGANEWGLFWNITLPLLRDSIRTSFLFIAISAFNMFAITQVMTQGGPNGATTVLSTYLYDRAFTSSRFGYAAAIAVALFLLMLLLSAAANFVSRRDSVEY